LENLTLIIPAKNEKESLPSFLDEVNKLNCKKLIVLQKEDIETQKIISENQNVKILIQKNNGYGNALIEGINASDTEYCCIINADGSMDPKYLKKMLEDCKDIDLVFASRYEKNGGSEDDTLVTYTGNKIFSFIGNFLFKLNISDILYTFVLGKTNSFKSLNLKSYDFRLCVEIPIKAKKNNLKYLVTPSKERSRIAGTKKVNAIKDGLLILIGILSYKFMK
tara:strand:+ start:1781 stop:2446 length:666 start_codon:yes stop_codon:yes gene_type:complete